MTAGSFHIWESPRVTQSEDWYNITSVIRASDQAFEVHWQELTYQNGAPIRIDHLTGLVTIMFKKPGAMTILTDNPLGAYVDKFDFGW